MTQPPPDAPLEILAQGPFNEDQVQARWQARAPITDAAAIAHTNARWDIYLREARLGGKSLFDGPVTLLAGFAADAAGLTVGLSVGCYKEFLVTTLRDHAWYAAHAPGAVAPALGNSALLTYHGRAALAVRSARVSAYAGCGHLFGGVLDAAPGDGGGSGDGPGPDLFINHLLKELREEAGLRPEELTGRPTLLALARDPVLRQPELIWRWELAVEPEKLAHRLDPREHDRLLILTVNSAEPTPLTPVAQAALRYMNAR